MNLIEEVLRREDLERRFKDTGLTTKEVEVLFRLRRNDYFSVSLKLARAVAIALRDLGLIENMPPNERESNAPRIAQISLIDIEKELET